ncbi:MAG: AgmX/PglI C-terminal domain-containing protein [Alphaproteobacteria bacterium]|nr:AgmX/PglI C-terminal domain-containing protein [Alphaproteobacteria bacterium]
MLLVCTFSLLAAGAAGVLAFARARVPLAVWLVLPGLLVVLGMVGAIHACSLGMDLLGFTRSETASAIAARVSIGALSVSVYGLALATIALVVTSWALALGTALGVREGGSRPTRALAVGAVVLASAAAAATLARSSGAEGALWIPGILLLAGPSVAVVALRGGAPAPEGRRVAAAASGVGVVGMLGVALATLAVHKLEAWRVFEVMAYLGPEGLGPLVQRGAVTQAAVLQAGAVAALGAGLAALVGTLPAPGLLAEARSRRSAAAVALLLLVVTGIGVAQERALAEVRAWTLPEVMALPLRVVPTLPSRTLPEGLAEPTLYAASRFPILAAGAHGWVALTPAVAPAPVEAPRLAFDAPDVLAVGPETPARALLALGEGSVTLLVQGEPDEGAGLIPVSGLPMTVGLAGVPMPLQGVVDVDAPADPSALQVEDGASGAAALAARVAADPVRPVAMVPGADWTVQDLVTLCMAARGVDGGIYCFVLSELPPPPAAPPELLLREPSGPDSLMVLGALEPEEVREAVRSQLDGLQACYPSALQDDPGLSGAVKVKVTIGVGGRVHSATLHSSTLGEPTVEACVVSAFERMTFPKPRGGGLVIARIPVILPSE